MKLVDLLISTRQSVLQLLKETKDSNGSLLGWDRTRSNSSTKYRLETLLQESIEAARPFGIHLVTRHSPCGASSHPKGDYLMESAHIEQLKYQDDRFEWTGAQHFQGSRATVCPCSPTSRARDHHQIDDFIIEKGRATRRHRLFVDALERIAQARDDSYDRSSRSSIRESLLRTVLSLNDGILPQSVDEYILASDIGEEVRQA